MKGTGFSPYIFEAKSSWALAPEGKFCQTDPLPTPHLRFAAWNQPYADTALPARDFATCAAISQTILSSVISAMIPCEMTQ